ncbi:glycosyltransferase family 2 protein [Enterobacteriaceae bacterium]
MMFSIVIPLFNKETSIKATLMSIINQDYKEFEIIVIDDGSTDHSAQVVDTLIIKHPEIKLYKYSNSGVSVARNRGIHLSQGDYIIFLDADDSLKMGYLKDAFTTIKKTNGDFAILGYNYLFNGKRIVPSVIKDGYINYFKMYLTYGPPFCSSSVIINKSKIKNCSDLFPEKEWLGEDIYAWSKVILEGGLVYYRNIVAAEYIVQPNSAMSKKKEQIKIIRNNSLLHGTDPYFKKFVTYHKKDYIKSCFAHREYATVRDYLKENNAKDFMFYKLLSLLPDNALDFIVNVKRTIK